MSDESKIIIKTAENPAEKSKVKIPKVVNTVICKFPKIRMILVLVIGLTLGIGVSVKYDEINLNAASFNNSISIAKYNYQLIADKISPFIDKVSSQFEGDKPLKVEDVPPANPAKVD